MAFCNVFLFFLISLCLIRYSVILCAADGASTESKGDIVRQTCAVFALLTDWRATSWKDGSSVCI